VSEPSGWTGSPVALDTVTARHRLRDHLDQELRYGDAPRPLERFR